MRSTPPCRFRICFDVIPWTINTIWCFCGSPETGVGGFEAGWFGGQKRGRLRKRWLGTEMDSRLSTAQGAVAGCDVGAEIAAGRPACQRAARVPPHALRPCRVTRRPSPPLGEQLWALRPRLDGGVPAVNGFTPDARRAVDGWAGGVRGHVAQWRPQTRGLLGCGGIELQPFPPPTPVFRRLAFVTVHGPRGRGRGAGSDNG